MQFFVTTAGVPEILGSLRGIPDFGGSLEQFFDSGARGFHSQTFSSAAAASKIRALQLDAAQHGSRTRHAVSWAQEHDVFNPTLCRT
jgi:hypothetical protein